MRAAEYAAAVKRWQANRRAVLSEVFVPGMTVSESADALALALGISFSTATVRNDLLELGFTPANGTERRLVGTRARREEVRTHVLAGESVQSLAERLRVPVHTIKADCHVLVEAGDLPADMLARGRVQRRLATMKQDMAHLGPEAQAAYEALWDALDDVATANEETIKGDSPHRVR